MLSPSPLLQKIHCMPNGILTLEEVKTAVGQMSKEGQRTLAAIFTKSAWDNILLKDILSMLEEIGIRAEDDEEQGYRWIVVQVKAHDQHLLQAPLHNGYVFPEFVEDLKSTLEFFEIKPKI